MSRFTLEPLMAVRHFSNPPTPPRQVVHSRLLATLDQEIEKMNFGDTSTPTYGRSNTMKMALDSVGNKEMKESQHHALSISQNPIPPFFPTTSSVISTVSRTHKKTTPSHTDIETQTSRKRHTHLSLEHSPQEQPHEFPLYSYKSASPTPTRHYIRDEIQANELVSKLQGPLGFDLEWRVIFAPRMTTRKTAVLQLCDERMILIIQLTAMKHIPQNVKEIMERQDIIKMGVNILNDGRKLQRDYGIMSAGLLEMSHLARLVDPSRVTSKRMISLQRIVEMYTGCTLSKGSVRTSNWEARLNEEQLEYAANDAHSALSVYTELMRMASTGGMKLSPLVIPGVSPMGITFVSESSVDLDIRPNPKGVSRRAPSKPTSNAEGRSRTTNSHGTVEVPPRLHSLATHITSLEQLQASKATGSRPVGGQVLRAYKLWHEERLSLPDICSALRSPANPLTKGTVITYIVQALKTDASLPFSRERLKELIMLETSSSKRHGWWVISLDKTNRGT